MKIANILLLRGRQTLRFIRETGLLLLVALLVSIGVVFQVLEKLRSLEAGYLMGVGFMIVATLHFGRKDLRFLAKITAGEMQLRLILLTEYLLVLSPLILLFLLAGPWRNGLAVAVAPVAALVLPVRSFFFSERKRKRSLSWIPLRLFELKLHAEKSKFGYALCYALVLLSPVHIGFFIVGMFFLSTLLLTAFRFYEPKELVHPEAHFLRGKIGQNLWFLTKAMAPAILLAFAFQYRQWPFVLYLSLFPFLTASLGLLHKYARLNPLFHQPPNSITPTVFLVLLLFPVGLPVHIGYLLFLTGKARKNLHYYYA